MDCTDKYRTYAVEAQSGSVTHVTGQIVVGLGQVGG